jgi:hypothetical protein
MDKRQHVKNMGILIPTMVSLQTRIAVSAVVVQLGNLPPQLAQLRLLSVRIQSQTGLMMMEIHAKNIKHMTTANSLLIAAELMDKLQDRYVVHVVVG